MSIGSNHHNIDQSFQHRFGRAVQSERNYQCQGEIDIDLTPLFNRRQKEQKLAEMTDRNLKGRLDYFCYIKIHALSPVDECDRIRFLDIENNGRVDLENVNARSIKSQNPVNLNHVTIDETVETEYEVNAHHSIIKSINTGSKQLILEDTHVERVTFNFEDDEEEYFEIHILLGTKGSIKNIHLNLSDDAENVEIFLYGRDITGRITKNTVVAVQRIVRSPNEFYDYVEEPSSDED